MGVGYFRNNSSAHWLWRLTLAQGLCIHCLSTLKAVLRLQLKKLRLREAPGCSSWKTERLGALFHSLWLHKPARSPYTMFIRCGGTEFCFISKHKFCLVLLTPQGNLEILTASFHLQLVSEPKGNIMSSGDFTANNPIENVMSRTSYTLRQKPLINDKSSSETKTTVIFLYLLNT